MVWTWNLDQSCTSLRGSFWTKFFFWNFADVSTLLQNFRILLISADVIKIWKKNHAKMFLLMIYNYGPNFMFIPFTKLELFKKQILLTSAFFGFCDFSRKWGPKQLGNTPTGKLHHGTLRIQPLVFFICRWLLSTNYGNLHVFFFWTCHNLPELEQKGVSLGNWIQG